MRALGTHVTRGLRRPHQGPAVGAVSQPVCLQPLLGTDGMLWRVGICPSEIAKGLVKPIETGTVPRIEPEALTSNREETRIEWWLSSPPLSPSLGSPFLLLTTVAHTTS